MTMPKPSGRQPILPIDKALEEISLRMPHSFGIGHEGNYPHAAVAALVAAVTDKLPCIDSTSAHHMTDTPTAHAGARQDSTPEQAGPAIEALTSPVTAWYSSNDEEIWHGGPYDTREEAEAGAKAEEHRLIMQATKGPVRVSKLFDGDEFFEQAEESLCDIADEDGNPILDFAQEVCNDLQTRVRAAIDEWQVAHRLSPMAWRFDSSDPVEIAAWAKGGAA